MVEIKQSINKIKDFSASSEIIGIMVGQTGPDQLHCGIVFKNEGKFNAIHLAWHYFLQQEIDFQVSLNDYLWITSSIHNIRQNSISAMCRRILKRQDEQNIPYGILYSGGKFTENGIMKLDTKESGLTCATFVLAVFKSCNIELIDIDRWKPRPSDSKWHSNIIKILKDTKDRFNISDIHIDNIEKEKGCSRFRPEEVAISSFFKNIPASSEEIISKGELLRNCLVNK